MLRELASLNRNRRGNPSWEGDGFEDMTAGTRVLFSELREMRDRKASRAPHQGGPKPAMNKGDLA